MAAATIEIQESFGLEALREVCGRPGPCLTALLPGYRPGGQSRPDTAGIQHLIQEFEGLAEAKSLLAPLRALADRPELEAGGRGFAFFSWAGATAAYRVDSTVRETLVVAKEPLVRPLLAEAGVEPELYALGLNRKQVRLFHCQRGRCEELPLPAGVPSSLLEAEASDQPDHTLANRSASGSSTGSMRAVKFGTSSDREAAPEYLQHFFTALDRGLHPLIRNTPLLLMAVHEEVAMYRKISQSRLLPGEFDGGQAALTVEEVAQRARAAVLEQYRLAAAEVLRKAREMREHGRVLQNIHEIVAAAEAGRVHQLVVAEDGNLVENGEDLLNDATVKTIRHSGQVFTLPSGPMGAAAPAAAILRY